VPEASGDVKDDEGSMRFRKKPVIVEAEQFHENAKLPFAASGACCWDGDRWYVVTAHGERTTIIDGDWIIAEPDGRGHYPCKPDIFEATYEPLEFTSQQPHAHFEFNDQSLESVERLKNRGVDTFEMPEPE
jgi:hypothetical protein